MKLRLLSVMIGMRKSSVVKLILALFLLVGFALQPAFAGKKKKKKAPSGEKVSLFKRAYEDVTTRNNYYFNADLQWKETVANIKSSKQIDYDSILPIYFYDKTDLSSYNSEWDNIIKKMGLVMQMHDYTRWKDNAYLLLGEAHFMKGEYDKALQTFQYISTTMKGPIGRQKLSVTNKERLQIMREMEKKRKKQSKDKKKLIEFKIDFAKKEADEKQEVAQNKAETAKKEAQKKAAQKQKVLKEKIKLKEKYIELKARGKSVEPTFTAYYQKNSKYAELDTILQKQKTEPQQATTPDKPVDYSKLRIRSSEEDTSRLSAENRTEENPLADSSGRRMNKRSSDLSFWEKIKHKPSRPDAIVWMAKSLMKKDEGETAHALIQYGQALKKLTRANKRDLQLVEAYYYVQRSNYELAMLPMENTIVLTKKKKNKAYYQYILAQIQERTGRYTDALLNYKLARKNSNDYELSFYSQMSMAKLYGQQGMGKSEAEITSKLKKLVRGGKNKEFADQVYYSLAQISLRNGDTTAAIQNLQKSVNQKSINTKQKGLSYLLLSNLAIEQNQFRESANYADSVIAYLPKDNPDAIILSKKIPYLDEIADKIDIITHQDSMLLLSRMTEEELNAYMASLLIEKESADKKKRRKENWSAGTASNNISSTGNAQATSSSATSSNGKWYFYNPDLKAQGYNQFIMAWGNRVLADGWRRSQKTSFTEITDNSLTSDTVKSTNTFGSATENATSDAVSIKLMIPKTPEEIKAANDKISGSLYNIGYNLRSGLNRPDKAVTYFERLYRDYPKNMYIQQTSYYLYLAYTEMGNAAKADYYKEALLGDNPNSIYSKNITNPPNYTMTREKVMPPSTPEETYYASTYATFNNGNYSEVLSRKKYAQENYAGGKYIPQIEFLSALSQGYLQNIPELKNELSQIILKYPNTEVQQKAQEYLKYLSQSLNDSPTANKSNEPVTLTIPEPNRTGPPETPYQTGDNNLYFMAYFPNKDNMLETYKQRLTFIGDENFGKDKYRTSNAYLDSEKTVLLAKRFKSEEEAKKYLEVINKNYQDIFASAKVELFIISQTNFRTFFDDKNIEPYRTFYQYYFK